MRPPKVVARALSACMGALVSAGFLAGAGCAVLVTGGAIPAGRGLFRGRPFCRAPGRLARDEPSGGAG
ncbi:MAG TPA: hypothetical protein VGG34_09705 [Opitutaceae bacterium]